MDGGPPPYMHERSTFEEILIGEIYEAENVYDLSRGHNIGEVGLYRIQENSGFLQRTLLTLTGCGHIRALDLDVLTRQGEVIMSATRPFRLGGAFCMPQRMTITKNGETIGSILEHYTPYCAKLVDGIVCCATSMTVFDGTTPIWKVRASPCGRNCCAPSPCFHVATYDVVSIETGYVVAGFDLNYRGNAELDCWRWCGGFNNFKMRYPVEPPPNEQSAEQEAERKRRNWLLVFLAVYTDYALYTKRGGGRDGSKDSL